MSEQLFPYARAHVGEFLKQNLMRPEVQEDLRLLAGENRARSESTIAPPSGSEIRNELYARAYLVWLMENDRKSTALKSIQGKIWKTGFESGELKGTLFPDVPDAFAAGRTMRKSPSTHPVPRRLSSFSFASLAMVI